MSIKTVTTFTVTVTDKKGNDVEVPMTTKKPFDVSKYQEFDSDVENNITPFEEFLKTGKTNAVVGDLRLVAAEEGIVSINKIGVLTYSQGSGYVDFNQFNAHTEDGVIIGNHALIDGENDLNTYGLPTFSPTILYRLLNAGKTPCRNVMAYFAKKKGLTVVDLTEDYQSTPTKEILQAYKKESKKKGFSLAAFNSKFADQAPQRGTTLITQFDTVIWHSSPTILFACGDRSFIMGQDEGSYFGCELKDNPTTILEAYESLKPAAARGRDDWIRQGEWFAVPVNQTEVPSLYNNPEVVASSDDGDYSIALPRENEESNIHTLNGNFIFTRSGRLLVRHFSLDHDDHGTIYGKNSLTWYELHKNTAVSSYSVRGVD